MHKMFKRVMTLILSLVMALSLAACGGGNDETKVPDNKTEAPADNKTEAPADDKTEAPADDKTEAPAEPTVFTIGLPYADYGNGIHTEKNAFLQLLKEELNVELDIMVYDADKLSLWAAGGDYPDMMVISGDATILTNILESGYIVKLNDLLDQYGQNIKANIPAALDLAASYYDGDILYMATHVTSLNTEPRTNGYIGYRARYDIWKAIGSPEFTTMDEYLDVLKQMVEYERQRTGEKDIYALSSFIDWDNWVWNCVHPFMQGYTNGPFGCTDRTTGEFVVGQMDPDSVWWEGIEFFNKAYRLGIFDADGLTQKYQQYKDKVASGKLIADVYGGNPDTALCGDEAVVVYLPGTGKVFGSLCGTYETPVPTGYGSEASRVITTNCKNPELAMQVWDFMDSEIGVLSLMNGVQGEDWDYVDGVPQITEKVVKMYADDTAGDYLKDRTAENFCKWSLFSGALASGVPIDLTASEAFRAANASERNKSFAEDFGFSYPGQVYDYWIQNGEGYDVTTDVGALKTSFQPQYTDEAMAIYTEMENYIAANISKVIMAESESEFKAEQAKMIEKFKELGVDKATEENRQIIEASHAEYERIFGK